MIGARALLAFSQDERDKDVPSEPSDDALLGALMHSEAQAAMVMIAKIMIRFFG